MTCSGRSSFQVISHGLHSSVPSPSATGDVAGEVVVVTLAPERAGEQDQLFLQRQVGNQLLGGSG